MPPLERSAGATEIGGGTESCVDDWNPGDSRSGAKVDRHSQVLILTMILKRLK